MPKGSMLKGFRSVSVRCQKGISTPKLHGIARCVHAIWLLCGQATKGMIAAAG